MKIQLEVTGPGLELFGEDRQKRGGGWNFRIKIREGVLAIKPSSRKDCVIEEMFGMLDQMTGKSIFDADQDITDGSYSFKLGSNGWQILTLDPAGHFHFKKSEIIVAQIPQKTSRPTTEIIMTPLEVLKTFIPGEMSWEEYLVSIDPEMVLEPEERVVIARAKLTFKKHAILEANLRKRLAKKKVKLAA